MGGVLQYKLEVYFRENQACTELRATISHHLLPPSSLQQFPRVTSIARGTPQSPAEPSKQKNPQSPRETPAEPSERQISSESLAEGCAPWMVTLRNFRNPSLGENSGFISGGASGVSEPRGPWIGPVSESLATESLLSESLTSESLSRESPSVGFRAFEISAFGIPVFGNPHRRNP